MHGAGTVTTSECFSCMLKLTIDPESIYSIIYPAYNMFVLTVYTFVRVAFYDMDIVLI
jgi:hypothetical protein